MQTKPEYQPLLYACRQEGCPLCRLTQENVHRYLDSWKYEFFTDDDVRTELRRSQGFCHTHTWELVRMGASLQLAQTYRVILADLTEQLQAGTSTVIAPQLSGGFLRRLFENRQESSRCLACRQQEEVEVQLVDTLRHALLDSVFYSAFAASQGLCLPHFRLTYESKTTDTSAAWLPRLRQAQLACLQRLDTQLAEMIRKHDYHFKDEARGPEMLSWQRAAGLVAGEKDYA